MIIEDRVYGRMEVNEPVLLELLGAPSMLRLKRISQFGVPDKYYHFKNFYRYEHSIGVMLLLKKLGADLKEQVAGLLHDVSVLAFSHVGDWIFGRAREGNEDYHEIFHGKFIENTEISEILDKHGFTPGEISDLESFSLLDSKVPDLCADRVDYALREFKYRLNPAIVETCISGLINFDGEMVFNNQKSAYEFAKNFLELQFGNWASLETSIRYHLFSTALKIAIDKGYVTKPDFYKDEDFILNKIEEHHDKEILDLFDNLEKGNIWTYAGRPGKKVVRKFRHVDPKIKQGDNLVRLSAINPEFKKLLEEQREVNQEGFII